MRLYNPFPYGYIARATLIDPYYLLTLNFKSIFMKKSFILFAVLTVIFTGFTLQ